MVRANRFATSTIWGRLRRLAVIFNVATWGVALRKSHDVGDVAATPLINCLLVVADDAQLDLWAGQQFDQPLLRSAAHSK